jgi:cerevisin
MRGLITLSLVAAASAAPSFSFGHSDPAPLLASENAEHIPDSYIIKFKKHVTASGASDHHSWIQEIHTTRENERTELRKRGQVSDMFRGVKHTYKVGDFLGYAGHFEESVIEQIRRHPDVSYYLHFPHLIYFPSMLCHLCPSGCCNRTWLSYDGQYQ